MHQLIISVSLLTFGINMQLQQSPLCRGAGPRLQCPHSVCLYVLSQGRDLITAGLLKKVYAVILFIHSDRIAADVSELWGLFSDADNSF